MLDVALIDLIAAGLVRFCAPERAGDRAYTSGLDGEELIRRLTAADSDRIGRLTAARSPCRSFVREVIPGSVNRDLGTLFA